MEGFLENVVRGLIVRAPFLIVCIGGLALVALRWSRHPRSSILAALGLGTLLVSTLVSVVIYDLIGRLISRSQAFERAELIYSATSFLMYTMDAAGVALIVAAFLRRRSPSA